MNIDEAYPSKGLHKVKGSEIDWVPEAIPKKMAWGLV
jgi:hypothetical protein